MKHSIAIKIIGMIRGGMMFKTKLLSILLIITVFLICPVDAGSINITVSEDSYTDQIYNTANYGTEEHMYSMSTTTCTQYSYLKYYVPEYTEEAYLHIYTDGGYKNANSVVSVHRATNDWDENTITWNNPPGYVNETDLITSASTPSNNQWVVLNVSSVVNYPANYTFRLRSKWGYNDWWVSGENESYAPYLEIRTAPFPIDITWNNHTNSDLKAFTVNTGQVIRFEIIPYDSTNITTYNWSVNKIDQPTHADYFDYIVPSFDPDYPSTGIWEIRVEGTYTNSSKVIREWLISGLTEEQAPDFLDSFIDLDNRNRSGYIKDPWGREFPYYYSPGTNLISKGYYSGSDSGSGTVLKAKCDVKYGTIKVRVNNTNIKADASFIARDDKNGDYNFAWYANEYHDYFAVNSWLGTGTKEYYPISRRCIGQAPGVHWWRANGWHEIVLIHTQDDWWSIWDNGALVPNGYLHLDNLIGNVTSVELRSQKTLQMDNIEVYKDKYIYPPTEIKYGQYPKWWYPSTYPYFSPAKDYGIIVFGRGLTLQNISENINNESLMTYDQSTRTATIKTNLFIKNGAELNITNETLLVDTSSGSKIIAPMSGVTFRILNSTVTTTSNSPLIWGLTSTTSLCVYNPEEQMNDTNHTNDQTGVPTWDYRGTFVLDNSTVNNTCNLFIDGAHEVRINNTVFSNMSALDYGSNKLQGGQTLFNQKIEQSTGTKSIWFVPRNDLAAYSINNISFINPRSDIDFKIVGGQFIFNSTTIKNSNLSNIDISTKRAYKYSEFQFYRQIYENSDVGLLNCKIDENRLKVETNRSKIETKYYADIIVKDTVGNPVQNVEITLISSNNSYGAENLYEYDGYDPVGPGEGGVNGYGTDSPLYTTYKGGTFKRWYNAQQLNSTVTNTNGRTSLPSEDVNNSIVLTDYVLTNETGKISKESIEYDLTIKSPDSKSVYLQGINPDSDWYRKNPSLSTYTITAIIPDDSTGPQITGFAPSTENPFNPGETKNFRVWTDEPLKEMEWYVDGKLVSEGSLNYTWTITKDESVIKFEGSNANGDVSKSWDVWGTGGNSSDLIEFFPEDTSLVKNTGESVYFNVSSGRALTANWFVDGETVLKDSTSLTYSWDTAGVYSVTVSGSMDTEGFSNTWEVNVKEPEEPPVENKSIITIIPCENVAPGAQFDLGIKIDPSTPINGAQLDFIFDSSMVSITGVTEGDIFKQSEASTVFNSGTIDNSAGIVKNVYGYILGAVKVSAPGTFATVDLTAGNRTGMAEFNLSNVIISDTSSRSAPYTVTNASVLIDTAPVMDPICYLKSVDEKSALTFKVTAKDADGDKLILSASGLPEGAEFNTESGDFSWTPAVGQAGVYTFTFEVSDGYLTDSENVTVTVNKLNNPPVIDSFEPPDGSSFSEGERIEVSVNASDADGQALSYSIRIDGVEYSTENTYVWETGYSSSGNHTIEVAVSDGIEKVTEQNNIYINNYHPRWDVNQDGVVNILDITIIAQNYGSSTVKPYPRWDVNQDGVINIQDLTLAGYYFGETVV
ncbi:hypothetical protein MSSIH_2967 [Methanosarcina siciliae HI350]|uniref:Uncharacterized protein n=1 Tax=Methanosarcina siciliae HI350 TaxID=1434119 RepID=A0A0E3PGU1_9EURY|nr:DNRLRE domain-containing protein [Methanosarcina siciliae]AKB33657.1 hypothetical protein MSSIH_2967 [Methanosarcina siciliae HI350]